MITEITAMRDPSLFKSVGIPVWSSGMNDRRIHKVQSCNITAPLMKTSVECIEVEKISQQEKGNMMKILSMHTYKL